MINATKKWIFLKISGALLVPLMIWFIINFIAIYDQDFNAIKIFFTSSVSKFLFSIFIINAYFFSMSIYGWYFWTRKNNNEYTPIT